MHNLLTGYDHDNLGVLFIPLRFRFYTSIVLFEDLELEIVERYYYVVTSMHTQECIQILHLDDDVMKVSGIDDEHYDATEITKPLENCKANIIRNYKDTKKRDYYGGKLLEMCKTTSLCIFNDRIGSDVTTCKNTVIDYFIRSSGFLLSASDLLIKNFDPTLSEIKLWYMYLKLI